eukprot:SAG31_NODE_20412_length_575_cov_1.088235_1_plen_31_part_10
MSCGNSSPYLAVNKDRAPTGCKQMIETTVLD